MGVGGYLILGPFRETTVTVYVHPLQKMRGPKQELIRGGQQVYFCNQLPGHMHILKFFFLNSVLLLGPRKRF